MLAIEDHLKLLHSTYRPKCPGILVSRPYDDPPPHHTIVECAHCGEFIAAMEDGFLRLLLQRIPAAGGREIAGRAGGR